MTKAGFGEHLKREREMRGVSLDEICAATRIGNRFLEALESEEWERLPGGVFNRGFVRAVARFLGLDEEAFVAEYVLATSEQNPTPEWAKHPTPPVTPPAVALAALGRASPRTHPDCGGRFGAGGRTRHDARNGARSRPLRPCPQILLARRFRQLPPCPHLSIVPGPTALRSPRTACCN